MQVLIVRLTSTCSECRAQGPYTYVEIGTYDPRPEITKELPSFIFKICIALNLLNIEELLRHISARQGPMTVHNRFLFCVCPENTTILTL